MARLDREGTPDRVKAVIGVALFHALLGYALVSGFGVEVARKVGSSLTVFDISEAPPPPVEITPPAPSEDRPEGPASPPNLAARPTPVVAPPPPIQLPVPPQIPTAPAPAPLPTGSERTAGASDMSGPGFGSGGEGSGQGGGGAGDGTGGGGGAMRAQRERGQLSNSDYPRAALRAGAQGTVSVRYVVGTDGRVSGCTVTRSSGHAELDATTCRLIEQRFRYRPARNAQGVPVTEPVTRTYDWLLPGRG